MILNHDCVRAILITMESLDYPSTLTLENYSNFPLLANCEPSEVLYTVQKVDEAGFLNVHMIKTLGYVTFKAQSLTWDGHQFLDNIRDDSVWKETKKVTSRIASVSLGILSDVASNVVKKTLGLE